MSDSLAIIAFPLIPMLAAVCTIMSAQLLRRDVSAACLRAAILGLITVGSWLIYRFYGATEPLYVPLSSFDYTTVLMFDGRKVFFTAALVTPVTMSLWYLHQLSGMYLRIVFLFYLTGCAGIIVTGDVFTFFIFYELMIMAAYVLITVKGRYYAGIKYMIVGSISSAFLLAAIMLLYATAGTFHFEFVHYIGELATDNLKFIMLLFSMAFFVKSAFFPASGWVSTCHSAANSLVSAFLSSFTVFTGIYGLVFLVLEPAAELGFTPIFSFLRVISLLTIVMSSLFVFLEPDLKRCTAGSTIFSIGFIGLLLSYQMTEHALTYVMIHALYKSMLFLLGDHLHTRDVKIFGNGRAAIVFILAALSTTGFFPTFPYFLKHAAAYQNVLYSIIMYVSMLLMLGGFLKFRLHRTDATLPSIPWSLLATVVILLGIHTAGFPFFTEPSWYKLPIEAGIFTLALTGSRCIYRKASMLHRLDTRLVFPNLNVELLLIMLLFFAEIVILRYLLP